MLILIFTSCQHHCRFFMRSFPQSSLTPPKCLLCHGEIARSSQPGSCELLAISPWHERQVTKEIPVLTFVTNFIVVAGTVKASSFKGLQQIVQNTLLFVTMYFG